MKVNLCFPRRDYKLTTPIYNIWLQMRWRMKEINLIPKKVVLQYVLYNRQEFYIIIIISHNNNNTNIKVSNNLKKKIGEKGNLFFYCLIQFHIVSCVVYENMWMGVSLFLLHTAHLILWKYKPFFFSIPVSFSIHLIVWARGCVLLWVRVSCCSWRRLYPISFLYE